MQVNNCSNRIARAFQRAGIGKGDVVALVMSNQIEYVCVWIGLAKLGALTALINRNLKDTPLAHTINTARAKAVLFGEEYTDGKSILRVPKAASRGIAGAVYVPSVHGHAPTDEHSTLTISFSGRSCPGSPK